MTDRKIYGTDFRDWEPISKMPPLGQVEISVDKSVDTPITPRALVAFTNGSLTIASDITLDEARYVIEQLATMVVSRGTMRELTIESE